MSGNNSLLKPLFINTLSELKWLSDHVEYMIKELHFKLNKKPSFNASNWTLVSGNILEGTISGIAR